MKRLWLTIMLQCLFVPVLLAGDSIYSLRGIGIRYDYGGGRSAAMGGAGVAIADSVQLNWLNPASLSELRRVTVSAQFFLQNLRTGNGKTGYWTGYANFFGFYGAFSVGYHIGFGFGLKPVSKVAYRFEDQGEIGRYTFTRLIDGNGGLNRFYFEGGFRPLRFLRVGAGVGYIFGKTDENLRINFLPADMVPTFDQYRSKYSGSNAHVGVHLSALRFLQIGAYYETGYNLAKTGEIRKVNPSNGRVRIMTSVDTTLRVPPKMRFGAAANIGSHLLVAADYAVQDWTGYGSVSDSFRRAEKMAVGLEYRPMGRYDAPFLTHLAYRLGFSWERPYLTDFENRPLHAFRVTAGIGIPYARHMGFIDLVLEYGKRGSLNKNTFEENLFRFSVVVTGSEWWFVR